MNTTKKPLVVHCNPKSKEIYDNLLKDEMFSGMRLKEVFLFAMALGYYKNRRKKLPRNKLDFIRTIDFEIKENIINSIAVAAEGNLDIVGDKKKVYSIVEEYAEGGIELLNKMILKPDEYGTPRKIIENELIEIVGNHK